MENSSNKFEKLISEKITEKHKTDLTESCLFAQLALLNVYKTCLDETKVSQIHTGETVVQKGQQINFYINEKVFYKDGNTNYRCKIQTVLPNGNYTIKMDSGSIMRNISNEKLMKIEEEMVSLTIDSFKKKYQNSFYFYIIWFSYINCIFVSKHIFSNISHTKFTVFVTEILNQQIFNNADNNYVKLKKIYSIGCDVFGINKSEMQPRFDADLINASKKLSVLNKNYGLNTEKNDVDLKSESFLKFANNAYNNLSVLPVMLQIQYTNGSKGQLINMFDIFCKQIGTVPNELFNYAINKANAMYSNGQISSTQMQTGRTKTSTNVSQGLLQTPQHAGKKKTRKQKGKYNNKGKRKTIKQRGGVINSITTESLGWLLRKGGSYVTPELLAELIASGKYKIITAITLKSGAVSTKLATVATAAKTATAAAAATSTAAIVTAIVITSGIAYLGYRYYNRNSEIETQYNELKLEENTEGIKIQLEEINEQEQFNEQEELLAEYEKLLAENVENQKFFDAITKELPLFDENKKLIKENFIIIKKKLIEFKIELQNYKLKRQEIKEKYKTIRQQKFADSNSKALVFVEIIDDPNDTGESNALENSLNKIDELFERIAKKNAKEQQFNEKNEKAVVVSGKYNESQSTDFEELNIEFQNLHNTIEENMKISLNKIQRIQQEQNFNGQNSKGLVPIDKFEAESTDFGKLADERDLYKQNFLSNVNKHTSDNAFIGLPVNPRIDISPSIAGQPVEINSFNWGENILGIFIPLIMIYFLIQKITGSSSYESSNSAVIQEEDVNEEDINEEEEEERQSNQRQSTRGQLKQNATTNELLLNGGNDSSGLMREIIKNIFNIVTNEESNDKLKEKIQFIIEIFKNVKMSIKDDNVKMLLKGGDNHINTNDSFFVFKDITVQNLDTEMLFVFNNDQAEISTLYNELNLFADNIVYPELQNKRKIRSMEQITKEYREILKQFMDNQIIEIEGDVYLFDDERIIKIDKKVTITFDFFKKEIKKIQYKNGDEFNVHNLSIDLECAKFVANKIKKADTKKKQANEKRERILIYQSVGEKNDIPSLQNLEELFPTHNNTRFSFADLQNPRGVTALMNQTKYGTVEAMDFLISKQPNLNLKDNEKNTALNYTIGSKNYMFKAYTLLKNGSELNEKYIYDINNQIQNEIRYLEEQKNALTQQKDVLNTQINQPASFFSFGNDNAENTQKLTNIEKEIEKINFKIKYHKSFLLLIMFYDAKQKLIRLSFKVKIHTGKENNEDAQKEAEDLAQKEDDADAAIDNLLLGLNEEGYNMLAKEIENNYKTNYKEKNNILLSSILQKLPTELEPYNEEEENLSGGAGDNFEINNDEKDITPIITYFKSSTRHNKGCESENPPILTPAITDHISETIQHIITDTLNEKKNINKLFTELKKNDEADNNLIKDVDKLLKETHKTLKEKHKNEQSMNRVCGIAIFLLLLFVLYRIMDGYNEYNKYQADLEANQQVEQTIAKHGIYSYRFTQVWNATSSAVESVGTAASYVYSAPGYLYNNGKQILFGAGGLALLYAFKDLITSSAAAMVPILFIGTFVCLGIINDYIFEKFRLTRTLQQYYRYEIALTKFTDIIDDPEKRAKFLENTRGKTSVDVFLKEIETYRGGYKNKGRTHKMKFKKGKTQKNKMKGNRTQKNKMKGGVYLTSEQQKNVINMITVILKMFYGIINDEYQRMDQLINGFRTNLIENFGTNLQSSQLLESSPPNNLLLPPPPPSSSNNLLLPPPPPSSSNNLSPPTPPP